MTAPKMLSRLGLLTLFVAASAQLAPAAARSAEAERALLISPGSHDSIALVDRACPTFSWAEVTRAEEYQLTVYDATDPEGELPVILRRALPAGVSSFTPAPGECLENGMTYAWMIWANGPWGESWSDPSLFAIRSHHESELTLRLQRAADLMAQLNGLEAELAAEMAFELNGSGRREGAAKAQTVGVSSAMTMPLMNVSNLVDTDFFLGNALSLTNVTAVDISCFFCVNGSDIGNGEVTGLDLAFGGVGFTNIVDGAVHGEKIVDSSIQSSHIADGAVDSADLAVGSIGESELADQSVLVAKLNPFMKRIECNGECGDAVLGDVCGGFLGGAIAVFSPHSVPDPGGPTSTCGGDNQCRLLTQLSPSTSLGALCPDSGGWDCIVICA